MLFSHYHMKVLHYLMNRLTCRKHRTTWYELEKLSGGLNAAGEAELAALKAGLANMAMGGTLLNHSAGGESGRRMTEPYGQRGCDTDTQLRNLAKRLRILA